MNPKRLVVVVAASVLVAGLLLVLRHGRRTPAPRADIVPTADALLAAVGGSPSDPRTRARSEKDARRAVLLQAIRKQAARRSAGSADTRRVAPERSNAALEGQGSSITDTTRDEAAPDQEYVGETMQSLVPDVMACYREGLRRTPGLAGRVVVKFTIEGEPGVGGVITENAIDTTASDLPDERVRECIADAMYALEIDPPSQGGVVHIEFPFTLAPPEH
ncbi:MAG: hypothetical protein JWP01_426 [Myxococcales bacterium]|nr:hypothetical protein [Myxococcales bacterium]